MKQLHAHPDFLRRICVAASYWRAEKCDIYLSSRRWAACALRYRY